MTRIPDGVRVFGIGALALTAILGIGYGFGAAGSPETPGPPAAAPEAAVAQPTPISTLMPAVVAVPPVPAQAEAAVPAPVPLAWRRPVTGPGRPPLPADVNGPYGSLRTTGTYEVALTFDDGPDPQWTPQVLGLLREYRIKATFCLIGVNVVEFPHLVRDIAADGHTLCNHSWAHDTGLGNRRAETVLDDMTRTNDAIRAAAPRAKVSYFRHPGGMWTETAVEMAKSLGMTSLHWDVDPKDWLKPGPRAISNTVNSSTVPGAIVLLHDGGGDRRGTTEALRSILPNLTARFPLVALPAGVDPPRKHGLQLPVHLGQL